MPDSNPRSRRSAAADQTRREIVEAARRLFLRDGYVGTTINAIADEAGVAVQTIYNSIGTKAAVLSRLLDVTIVGDHEDRGLLDRVQARPGFDDLDAGEIVRDLARMIADVANRIADVWQVVESAAAVDAEIAAIVARNDAQRFFGYTMVGNYRFLTDEQGWSSDRYRRWLAATLAHALLADPTERST